MVDSFGNACSFIMSNYDHFGSGQVPKGFGFALQNRGCNFNLEPNHPNRVESRKRPYHTIIPSMVLNPHNDELYISYGVMGGFMQPQGHVQVLLNIAHGNCTPQGALDRPRFCISSDNGIIYLEPGIPLKTQETLSEMGHKLRVLHGYKRAMFGRGQIIMMKKDTHYATGNTINVLIGGSDPRSDGQTLSY